MAVLTSASGVDMLFIFCTLSCQALQALATLNFLPSQGQLYCVCYA
jgi:hypothetical protein